MLKNLSMFVSDHRLCIRNIPASYSDDKLRKLVAKYAPPGAKLAEVRVMRDMKNFVDGVGVSKEYGFVSFGRHTDALDALRNLNNNPEIFGAEKRPIVDFSIENRKAIQARLKREEKSKQNNPNFKGHKSDEFAKVKNVKKSADTDNEPEKANFAGMSADPKMKTLPRH